MMSETPEFITIDPAADKQMLADKYEELTGRTLYPAQDAMIMINLIAYYANLIKTQFNDAAALNLVQYSRYPIIDFLGAYKNCTRTAAHTGVDILQINFNTVFSYDVTIPKGFQVKTSDGAYIFETVSALTVAAGETSGTVQIESEEACSDVNKYAAGEINTVISSAYSYIESVTNLNGVEGGSNDEDDEAYAERILLAPEGYSVAGPKGAYEYFAKTAHSSIVDVEIDIPQENIKIVINDEEYEMTDSTYSDDNYTISADYQEEEAVITTKVDIPAGAEIRVRIPHPYKVVPYVLTEEGEASQTVLDAVSEALENVRPAVDYVVPQSASVQKFSISGTVYLTEAADEDSVKEGVNEALNSFINACKNCLNKAVVKNQIIKTVCAVDGVYDFKPKSVKTLEACKYIAYNGTIGSIEYERTDNR